jgi:hypothetical protein
MAYNYTVKVNYKTCDERERRYIINKKLAGIINLAISAKPI